MKVVHYLNQFFAGLGAEDAAMSPPGTLNGPVGPARRLSALLDGDAEIVATVYCGDDYAAGRPEAVDEIVELVRRHDPDLMVAGPAFTSGRYGLACARLAAALDGEVPAVAAMHPDNPGLAEAGTALVVASGEVGREMKASLATLANAVRRIAAGEPLGADDGRIGQVARANRVDHATAAERAVALALGLARGEDLPGELTFEGFDRVRPAEPVADLGQATVVLATEGGLVPRGNPDGLESSRASRWLAYPLPDTDEAWESVDGGFDTASVNRDWRRLLPADAVRELEAEGHVGEVHDRFLVTTGNGTAVANVARYGVEWAAELHRANIQAALLTAT